MNDIQEITLDEAVRIVANAITAAIEDERELGNGMKPADFLAKTRIYTRSSRNPALNRNGEDYDFWLDIRHVQPGALTVWDENDPSVTFWENSVPGVWLRDDWSADWNYSQWGGAEYFVPNIPSARHIVMAALGYMDNRKHDHS